MKKHYTDSFGVEWKEYPNVQLDSENQYSWNISEARLELVLGFPLEFLKNKSVIEIGCGPGRFSEHFIKYCKDLTIVDSSDAINYNLTANHKNCTAHKKDFLDQGFIKENSNKFDIVFCRGVIQHTENRFNAIKSLFEYAKIQPAGLVIFDVYPRRKSDLMYFLTDFKYFWRKVLPKIITLDKFIKILKNNLEVLGKIHLFFKKARSKFFFKYLQKFLPFLNIFIMPDFLKDHPGIKDKKHQNRLIASLLVDAIYSYYDKPMTMYEINSVLAKIGQKYYSVDSNRCIVRCKRSQFFIECEFKETKNGIQLIKTTKN